MLIHPLFLRPLLRNGGSSFPAAFSRRPCSRGGGGAVGTTGEISLFDPKCCGCCFGPYHFDISLLSLLRGKPSITSLRTPFLIPKAHHCCQVRGCLPSPPVLE